MRINFWKTCRELFDRDATVFPSFSTEACRAHFRGALQKKPNEGKYKISNWIPTLKEPIVPFNDLPPTYSEVAGVINQSRTSSSPCPLDQMSVLVMKKCPIVRTVLHKLFTECWIQRNIPDCWKNALTILIYKKGDASNPANFRPITLQPIFYKPFASIFRNRLFKFLT